MSYLKCLVVLTVILLAASLQLRANSDIFPAEEPAKNSIYWKDGYFWINGKSTFITSGEMHYARIPRELWRDRIWRAKEMGFNCIQTYVFWNASEGKEGQWNFSDNLDLDAWLTAVQKEGLYAVVRVGPYCCAEWDQGGFPAWLTVKPGMTLRDSGEEFDKYAYPHLDQVEKIVAKHQINHGGNVIMVQLENEHPRGWGTDESFPYLGHLVDQARSNGLEIPLFLSGLHHGNDPAGDSPFEPGSSPWYSTEFWTGWIGKYGDMAPGMLAQKIACTWKIIAFGGAGYDYYVVHGGTNFGYSGCNHEATYDYAAPISEFGGFNNFYAPAKRAAYFAQSFAGLLTGSHDDSGLAKVDGDVVRVTTRTNRSLGSFIMLDRFVKKGSGGQIAPSASAYQAPTDALASEATPTHLVVDGLSLPHQGQLKVAPLEPTTVLLNIPWTANTSFESVCGNVLLRRQIASTDYWVCYGEPGSGGEITLKKNGRVEPPIDFTYPTDDKVQEVDLDSGDGHKAKILVMNTALTARTWLVQDRIYIGPSFVGEDGAVEFPMEGGTAIIYSASGKQSVVQSSSPASPLPTLAEWSWRDGAPERAGELNDDDWQKTMGPQPIGAVDSFQNRYAWYRTTLRADSTADLALQFAGGPGPDFAAFLNGQPASLEKLSPIRGENTLAILVKAEPRGTLYNKIGVVRTPIIRGLWGGVSTSTQGSALEVSWKTWKASGNPGNAEEVATPIYDASSWTPATDMPDVVKNHRWLRGTFTLSPEQIDSFIEAPGFNKWNSSLYLNGRQLPSLTQDISKILVPGTNVILLLVEGKADLGDLSLNLWPNASLAHAPWYFRGGLSHLEETPILGTVTDWSAFLTREPWQSKDKAVAGSPAFWKSSFTYTPLPNIHEALGVMTDGLQAGNVWLNGHNLGECPQKVPLYLPPCWLKNGANDLVIFDLHGSTPEKVKLSRYEASSVNYAAKF